MVDGILQEDQAEVQKMDWNKFGSRKLLVVGMVGLTTTLLALLGKMTGDVASVFTGMVIVYPAAQGWIDGKSIK